MTTKTTTRTGITIGCAFSSTLHPEEAAPVKIKAPPRFDRADRIVMAICTLALLALVVILAMEV